MNIGKNKNKMINAIYELIESPNMTDSIINVLLDRDQCEMHIGAKFRKPILKEVPPEIEGDELKEACKDGTFQVRYYPDIIKWKRRTFILSNYWYGPNTKISDNVTPFIQWVEANK